MIAALSAAHAAGVIHRDFKSENVFLVPGPDGSRVVVTDFGVARGVEHDQFSAQVTIADAAVGTPAYMAPEQIEGGPATAAIDQYALGVVLFEMVTGNLPFAGETPLATAVKRLTQAPPSPEELTPGPRSGLGGGHSPLPGALSGRAFPVRPRRRPGARRRGQPPASGPPSWLRGFRPFPGASSRPARRPRWGRRPRELPNDGARADAQLKPPDPKRRKQLWLLAAVSLVLALALVQAVVRVRRSLESPLGETGEVRRAVAVVPFRNLAQRDEFEWLSVALAEMVASELRAGEGLRTVSADDVARARSRSRPRGDRPTLGRGHLQSALPPGDRLRRPRLLHRARRRRVGYRSAWRSASRTPRRAETLGESVATGGEQELFQLVSKVGTDLRQLLGSAARDSRRPRSPPPRRIRAPHASIPKGC